MLLHKHEMQHTYKIYPKLIENHAPYNYLYGGSKTYSKKFMMHVAASYMKRIESLFCFFMDTYTLLSNFLCSGIAFCMRLVYTHTTRYLKLSTDGRLHVSLALISSSLGLQECHSNGKYFLTAKCTSLYIYIFFIHPNFTMKGLSKEKSIHIPYRSLYYMKCNIE